MDKAWNYFKLCLPKLCGFSVFMVIFVHYDDILFEVENLRFIKHGLTPHVNTWVEINSWTQHLSECTNHIKIKTLLGGFVLCGLNAFELNTNWIGWKNKLLEWKFTLGKNYSSYLQFCHFSSCCLNFFKCSCSLFRISNCFPSHSHICNKQISALFRIKPNDSLIIIRAAETTIRELL